MEAGADCKGCLGDWVHFEYTLGHVPIWIFLEKLAGLSAQLFFNLLFPYIQFKNLCTASDFICKYHWIIFLLAQHLKFKPLITYRLCNFYDYLRYTNARMLKRVPSWKFLTIWVVLEMVGFLSFTNVSLNWGCCRTVRFTIAISLLPFGPSWN